MSAETKTMWVMKKCPTEEQRTFNGNGPVVVGQWRKLEGSKRDDGKYPFKYVDGKFPDNLWEGKWWSIEMLASNPGPLVQRSFEKDGTIKN